MAEMATVESSRNFNYGYPTPGIQHPTGSQVMDNLFFLSEAKWQKAREQEHFDYIVIGSGFCALGFISQILKNKPDSRILVLERGPFFLPEHFQALPLPFQHAVGGMSETFPWTLSSITATSSPPRYITWQHGMVPFFGGRSTTWSAWCPRPTVAEMSGWPLDVVSVAHHYYPQAEELLNVIPSSEIGQCRDKAVYGVLQSNLKNLLDQNLESLPSATRVIYAPLAVRDPSPHGLDYVKFSTVGPMLTLVKSHPNLKIVNNCVVSRIVHQDGRTATALETSRGVFSVGNAKIILAMGSVPPATLVLNSFPKLTNVGKRLTSHFISSIVARVPRDDYAFVQSLEKEKLELGAIYVAGVDPNDNEHQYHIQLTTLYDPDPTRNAAAAFRYMPDVVATASEQQLTSSKGYVVFVCAVLGELENHNPHSWIKKNDGRDPTTNILLQVSESDKDLALWDVMDKGTFQALEQGLSPQGRHRVEYWHSGSNEWQKERPSTGEIRVSGLVHEGSTMHIGSDSDAIVDLDYKLKGTENIYVTGGSLFPKSGSWNPTLTMVALSQHLADKFTRN